MPDCRDCSLSLKDESWIRKDLDAHNYGIYTLCGWLMYTDLPKWPPEEEKVAHPWINF